MMMMKIPYQVSSEREWTGNTGTTKEEILLLMVKRKIIRKLCVKIWNIGDKTVYDKQEKCSIGREPRQGGELEYRIREEKRKMVIVFMMPKFYTRTSFGRIRL